MDGRLLFVQNIKIPLEAARGACPSVFRNKRAIPNYCRNGIHKESLCTGSQFLLNVLKILILIMHHGVGLFVLSLIVVTK